MGAHGLLATSEHIDDAGTASKTFALVAGCLTNFL